MATQNFDMFIDCSNLSIWNYCVPWYGIHETRWNHSIWRWKHMNFVIMKSLRSITFIVLKLKISICIIELWSYKYAHWIPHGRYD